MKKGVVVGIVCMFMVVSIPIVESEERYCDINNNSDRLEFIFTDIKDKMDDVDSQDECNLIFKDAVIELDKYGFLGDVDLEEVIQLVTSTNGNSYSISGKSSRTYFIGALAIMFYLLSNGAFEGVYLLEGVTYLLCQLFRLIKNVGVVSMHTSSWITFGSRSQDWEGGNTEWWPAKGQIKIVDSSGNTTEFSNFYGHIELIFEYGFDVNRIYSDLVGVKGFKGIFIGDYYMGSASEVDIGSNHP